MNAKDEAKLTMYRGIEQHLDTNSGIVSTINALATAVSAFKAVIAGIINTEQLTNVNLSGIALDKSNSKLALAQIAADISAVIAAYASATGNNTLEAEVSYTFNKLKRTRDEQLAPVCQIIFNRGTEYKAALKDYGINDTKIAALQTAITDYTAKTPNPHTAVGNRKTQTAQRRELFRQGDEILKKQIDKLIKNFRTSQPDFHNTYFNLREIPDASNTATQLKGIVTDSATNTPIKGATLTIVELNKTTKTDSAGKYSFKPVEHGKHTVRITAEGYQPFENDEIEVKLGDIRHLDVGLTNN
jgi:hypothetical protein